MKAQRPVAIARPHKSFHDGPKELQVAVANPTCVVSPRQQVTEHMVHVVRVDVVGVRDGRDLAPLRNAYAICVPFVVDDPLWLWAVLFVWGGTFSAIYTMSMAIAGQRFRGGQLANIMAAFGVMWGLGMTIGPATAGGAMDLWDPHGLPALLAVTCTVFVIFACWRQATKPAEQE